MKKIVILLLLIRILIPINCSKRSVSILKLLKRNPKKGIYTLIENRYDVDISNDRQAIKEILQKLTSSLNFYIRISSAEVLVRYYYEPEPWLSMMKDDRNWQTSDSNYIFYEGSIIRMGYKVNELIDKGLLEPTKENLKPFALYYNGKNFAKFINENRAEINYKEAKTNNDWIEWLLSLRTLLMFPNEEYLEIGRQEMEFYLSLSYTEKYRMGLKDEKVLPIFRKFLDESVVRRRTPDFFYKMELALGDIDPNVVEKYIYDSVKAYCRDFVDKSEYSLSLNSRYKKNLLIALKNARKRYKKDKNIQYAIDYAEDMIINEKTWGGTSIKGANALHYIDGWNHYYVKWLK